MSKQRNQLLLGVLLLVAGLYSLLLNTNILGPEWATSMPVVVGVAFIVAYLMGHKWAIIPGTVVTAIGLVLMLAAAQVIDLDLWWPLLIMAPGVSFIFLGIVRERYHLFPGIVITGLGLIMLAFSTGIAMWKWLNTLGYILPLVLILIGLLLLTKGRTPVDIDNESKEEEQQ